jgi:isoleucyl-tRNA synthetase
VASAGLARTLRVLNGRQKAANFAKDTVNRQRASFKRYGVWGDWDEPYMTLQSEYEAAQVRVLGDMVLKGHVYR